MKFEQILADIREDRSRGASELARRCLNHVTQYVADVPASDTVDMIDKMRGLAAALRRVRPSMVALDNLLDDYERALVPLAETALQDARSEAKDAAQSLIRRSRAAVSACASRMAECVSPGSTVFTHSTSSTVREYIRLKAGDNIRCIFTLGYPLCEGLQFADFLTEANVPGTLLADAEAALYIADADCVVVGADTVLFNGDVVNKSGTCLLALAARDAGIPFYVCCESFKLARTEKPDFHLEEMSPAEITDRTWPDITVRNVYFDITPARLVTGLVTEDGIHDGHNS